MNHHRQLELALKRQHLQFRCAEQRQELARSMALIKPAFAIADTVRGGLQWLRDHPALSIATLSVVAVARPRIALRWGRRAWLGWRVWRKLKEAAAPGDTS